MIFTGDISLPHKEAINFYNLPQSFYGKNWFANLEGALIKHRSSLNGVFNIFSAIKSLTETFCFKGLALANNHILDVGSYDSTVKLLNEINVPFCGIGRNTAEANVPIIINELGCKIVILNFGWEVIQCKIASKRKVGVNPLARTHVLNSLQNTISQYPNARVIPFMHWGYELESEPQPFERELAKKMIEMGAAGVIGSHSHRVGGVEIYNGKPIVYSLGNWLFKQNYYYGKKLSFPDFCNLELAFEWDFESDEYHFHFFEYDRKRSRLTYLRTEGKDSKTMALHTPFRGLSNNEYKKWYKRNHYHKRKGLPIYYWEDPAVIVRCKNLWNKLRDRMLKIIFGKGK